MSNPRAVTCFGVGNVPLIRLKRLSSGNVFAQAEFLNPGGSIKDRVAKHIIESAQRDGALRSKEKNPRVKIVAVEPQNCAALLGREPGLHVIQGIGDGFVPDVLDMNLVDIDAAPAR